MRKIKMQYLNAGILSLCMLIAFACMGHSFAEAGNGSIGEMEVVNCREWVSLRREPNASSARITKLPLGAKVTECFWYDSEFIYCQYNDHKGYVLAKYLEEIPAISEDDFYYTDSDESVLMGKRNDTYEGERVELTYTDPLGNLIWSRTEKTDVRTELENITLFLNGTPEEPVLMIYNAFQGLTALNIKDGSEIWKLSADEVSLGASISFAVAEDGTMYIGGYYGPDPAAISADGRVLWKTHNEHEAFWLSGIELTENGILAKYDAVISGDTTGEIVYDYEGNEISFKTARAE